MKYFVRHYKNYLKSNEHFFIGSAETLAEAKAMRAVSGDLVTDAGGNIIKSLDWLWDFELQDEDSYARRMIKS